MGGIIFHGSDLAFFLRIPPLIAENAMTQGIGAGEQGSVAGSGAGVGVIVTAVVEVSAVVHEQAKPVGTEIVVIALRIVAAKLVNNDHHYQLRPAIVGGSQSQGGQQTEADECSTGTADAGVHRRVV